MQLRFLTNRVRGSRYFPWRCETDRGNDSSRHSIISFLRSFRVHESFVHGKRPRCTLHALHVHALAPGESCDISVIISYGWRIASVRRNHLFRKMAQFCLPRAAEQAQYLRGYNLNKGSLCNTVYLFGHTHACPPYTMPMRNVAQFLLNVPASNGRVDSRAASQKRIIFCGFGQRQCAI